MISMNAMLVSALLGVSNLGLANSLEAQAMSRPQALVLAGLLNARDNLNLGLASVPLADGLAGQLAPAENALGFTLAENPTPPGAWGLLRTTRDSPRRIS